MENEDRGRKPRARRARTLTCGAGVVTVLVVILALVSPLAAGASVTAKMVILEAPYQGTTGTDGFFFGGGCGYTSSFPVFPTFNMTSGVFTGSVKASVRSCGSSESEIDSEVDGDLYSNQTFQTATGNHTVTVHWTLNYSVRFAGVWGGPGQSGYSYAAVDASAWLEDATNDTQFYIGQSFEYYFNSSSPTTHSYSEKITIKNSSLPLVTGHTYWVQVQVSAYVYAQVSPGNSSASVSVNMGSSGKKATLTSILVP